MSQQLPKLSSRVLSAITEQSSKRVLSKSPIATSRKDDLKAKSSSSFKQFGSHSQSQPQHKTLVQNPLKTSAKNAGP